MKFKNSIKLSLAAALLSLGACTGDFYEKNTNPDEATDEMLGWDDLRTGSDFMQLAQNVIPTFQIVGGEEYGSANFQVIQDLAGNIFAGYTGATKSSFRANNLYDILAAEWHNAMHDDAFQRAMGPWAQLDALREESPEAVALADVLKVAVMHRVTDTYGPIAYLSIGSSGIQQEYDSQEVIYNRFFEELDAAITLLTDFYEKNPSATLLANYDPIYKGNVRAWVKFANTLRLRLAMRVYYADRELSKAQAEAAINNSVGLMTDASDIAQFAKPATATQWEYPLYMIQYSFNGGDSRIGATIESYMNGYEDPRREAYFTKNSRGEYRGVRNGINITADYVLSDLLSSVNCTNNDAIVWMKPAEAWFLRAEYELHFGSKTAAGEYYNKGIECSFSTEGVSGVETYMTDNVKTPADYTDMVVSSNSASALGKITIAWEDSADDETMLERIITQKYLAIFPDGQEAWSEFRRTGYPKIFPNVINNQSGLISTSKQIRRLNFPSTEYATNAAAVQNAIVTLNGESSNPTGDNGGTTLWWDKKN
ncbi:SusD/RagB family nutrient-binding outer membrane lipoprotein [Alistipes megaguti]|uniref:SusD/RagB family nutrient-binding outer membrane lipoprotein n=1 Tax=Alistipes megaguti TaxID=2364787 RepID=UPI0023573CC4|nr:SusD/RagB family nutrient-binding outer membrane lipoprotein [Alistipes megaguti]